MQHKSFDEMRCPIARSLERVGEWWSIMILRDAFYGATRFDEFQKGLGIAPNMLTRRLAGLVEAGLMEKRRYSERPERFEYVLTQAGWDFRPVMLAMMTWGNKYFAKEGVSVQLVDTETGDVAEPIMVDRKTGREIKYPEFKVIPGPGADEATLKRIARREQLLAAGNLAGAGVLP